MKKKFLQFVLNLLRKKSIADKEGRVVTQKIDNEGFFYKFQEHKYTVNEYPDFAKKYYFPKLALKILLKLNPAIQCETSSGEKVDNKMYFQLDPK